MRRGNSPPVNDGTFYPARFERLVTLEEIFWPPAEAQKKRLAERQAETIDQETGSSVPTGA